MKAYTRNRYGGPEVLQLQDLPMPTVSAGQLLIKVMANSANPADWHLLRGQPWLARLSSGLLRPRQPVPGADFAGVVVQAGTGVANFRAGDRVFGETLMGSAFAEYVAVAADRCALMPADSSFAHMACLPVAGLTAWQALVHYGQVQPGEAVLINGSSGGVGHLAVQIAKARGATVTAVCSARNADFVQSLGADAVLPYNKHPLQQHNSRYDLVLDTHGNLRFADFVRLGRRGVLTGFTSMPHLMGVMLRKALSRYPLRQFTAQANQAHLQALAALVAAGQVRVHLDQTYSYKDLPAAIAYIEQLRTRGKVAMLWQAEEAGA